MRAELLAELLAAAADAVDRALGATADWGLAGTVPGQHRSDLVADEAACAVLTRGGVGILSEESGLRGAEREVVVVLDPLDGSTNAAHGVSWWATSLCAVDAEGPAVSLVVDLVHGRRFAATRGAGATCDGEALQPSAVTAVGDALVGLSGWPEEHFGWRQYRALGASALDLCAVAGGHLDGFVDCDPDAHGCWDYLGALLICREAGASVVDAWDRELVVLDHGARRTPVAGATPELLEGLLEARRNHPRGSDPGSREPSKLS